jgi:hypothetical protein
MNPKGCKKTTWQNSAVTGRSVHSSEITWIRKEVSMNRNLVVTGGLMLILRSFVLLGQGPAPAVNPIIGTWKQNMAKSTYSPGAPPPKGSFSVRQYAAGDGGSIIAVTMNVDPKGLPTLGAVAAANYDGKDYVQHTVATLATSLGSHIGPQINRTISYKAIDPYTVEIVQKQDGQIIARSTRTISRDGKTMTDRSDFTDPEGQRVRNVLVFEKQ